MTGGRQLPALFVITAINMIGFGIVIPVFPFFGRMVGAGAGAITIAIGAYAFGQFVGAPLWGKLSDRFGRRPVLIWSLVGAALSYVVMAYARDIWVLGASRLIGGLMAGSIAAAFAYVGDITDSATRPRAMGLLGAAFGIGFIFGPALGGFVAGSDADMADFANVGFSAAAITTVAALAAVLFLPESLTPDRRAQASKDGADVTTRQVLRNRPIVWALMVLVLLVIGSAAMMETTLAFFASDEFDWGPSDIGLAFAAMGLIAAGLQGGGAGPLAARFGSAHVAIAGVAFHSGGLILLASAHASWMMVAGLLAMSVGLGLFNPAFQTLAADHTDDRDRGLVMGLTQGASSLGRVIGPGVSGTIYQSLGHRAPFAIGAATMLLALAAAFLVAVKGRRPAQTQS